MPPTPTPVIGSVRMSRRLVIIFSSVAFIIGAMSIVQIVIAFSAHSMGRLAGAMIILPFGAIFVTHLIHGAMAVRRLNGVFIHPDGIYFQSAPQKIISWAEIDAEDVPLGANAFKSPGVRARLPNGDMLFFPATAEGSRFIRSALGVTTGPTRSANGRPHS